MVRICRHYTTAVMFTSCCKFLEIMLTVKVKMENVIRWLSCFKLARKLPTTIWVDVKNHLDTCSNKTCKGHEVDIMHFSIGNAIPGRLYGGNSVDNRDGNGGDRFGHLVDIYVWNPHCRYLDGISPSAMDSHRSSSLQRPSQPILHLNMDADDIIHPGPIDNSVLSRQLKHQTEAIWNPEVENKFPPRSKSK